MGLDEITGENSAGTDTTVVRTLGTGETHLGPTKDLSIGVKQGVLLLETEPRFLVLGGIHRLLARSPVVGPVGSAVVVVALAEDKNVLAPSERIAEDRDGSLRGQRVLEGNDTDGARRWGSRGRRQSCHRGPGQLMNRQSSTP